MRTDKQIVEKKTHTDDKKNRKTVNRNKKKKRHSDDKKNRFYINRRATHIDTYVEKNKHYS
jgi:hypothetical protein